MSKEQNQMSQNFEEHYIMGDKIGEGMHSEVYKCYKHDDSKTYAVKITREDDDEKKIAHRNEFKLTSTIIHPNIISSIDIFENNFKGEIYVVMDYIEGKELIDILNEKVKFDE
jgi:serine/threonine protein kinase